MKAFCRAFFQPSLAVFPFANYRDSWKEIHCHSWSEAEREVQGHSLDTLFTPNPQDRAEILSGERQNWNLISGTEGGEVQNFSARFLWVYFLIAYSASPPRSRPRWPLHTSFARSQEANVSQGSSQLSHQRSALMCYFFLKWQSLIPVLGLARFNLGRKCKSVHSAALQACWLSKFCLSQCLSGILVISLG